MKLFKTKILKKIKKQWSRIDFRVSPEKIMFACFFLVFFLTPVFSTGLFPSGPALDKLALFSILTAAVFFAYLAKIMDDGFMEIRKTRLNWLFLGLFISALLATLFSVSIKDSLYGSYYNLSRGFGFLTVFIIFSFVLANNIDALKIKKLIFGFLASSFLLTVYFLAGFAGKFIPFLGQALARFSNPLESFSALAILLVFTLPLGLAFFLLSEKESSWSEKIFFWAFLLFNLFSLFLLADFVLWPAAIVGLAVILVFSFSQAVKIDKSKIFLPLAVFMLLAAGLVLGGLHIIKTELPAEAGLSVSSSWKIAGRALKENPLFGSGPSTFYYDFNKFRGSELNNSPFWTVKFENSAGIFPEFLATSGAIFTLFLFSLSVFIAFKLFYSLMKSSGKEEKRIILALAAGLVSFMVLAAVSVFSNSLLLIFYLYLSLAGAASSAIGIFKKQTIKFSFKSSAASSFILSAFLFLVVAFFGLVIFTVPKMCLADFYAGRAEKAQTGGEKISLLEKAVSLFFSRDAYHDLAARARLDSVMKNGGGKADISQALKEAEQALAISPKNSSRLEFMALIYENASAGDQEMIFSAGKLYESALSLDPENPRYYLKLAFISAIRADQTTNEAEKQKLNSAAAQYFSQALEKKKDYAEAYFIRSLFNEKTGQIDASVADMKKALSLINNISIRFELARLYINRGLASYPEGKVPTEANADLAAAEQIFLSIISENSEHADSYYALARLYQRIGEEEKEKIMVDRLLSILKTEEEREAIRSIFSVEE